MIRTLVAVALGGAIGTALRLALDLALPHGGGDFPVSTLLINIVGAFTLGALTGSLWKRETTPAWLKAGLGPGLLGSFTTLSAVAVSAVAMTDAGAAPLAAIYVIVTVVAGFAAALIGLRLGGRSGATS
ncbi:fluoride efflux transporter FluC [Agromyces atrinae]|uniref:Fluoride-specific ion channel FluC n=1 Tax=Agromyces atrinae TaxID=592376 RepID=A0A4Q2M3B8_9MICO|nr:CrcB family protein [Agromyces atrinae]NYD68247.1 CrcB protein [Agromyces atrinae]RXZ85687.1 CrcB family protein [Agromyces atrinae]